MQVILDQEPLIAALTGGDPLLHPELGLLISMIKKQGAFLKLCTNGVALTKHVCEYVIFQLGMYDIIQISLDAADKKTYKSIRGADHFETLIHNIYRVRNCLPKVTIELHCVPNKFNIHQIPQIYSLAKELGADAFSTSPLAYLGRAKKEYQADISSLFLLERELYRSSDVRTPYMGCLFEVCSLYGMLHNLSSSLFETDVYRCDAGLSTLYVNCDAKVYPCVYLQYPAFRLGNLQEGLSTVIARAHEYYIDGISIKNSPCSTCNLWPICKGGCMGMLYAFQGKARPGLDPRCSQLNTDSLNNL